MYIIGTRLNWGCRLCLNCDGKEGIKTETSKISSNKSCKSWHFLKSDLEDVEIEMNKVKVQQL
jgi:hypothetical protein